MERIKTAPKIEDEIHDLLENDVQKNALEFTAYLNENNMTPQRWFGPTIWRVPYDKYYLCGIFLNRRGKFRVYFFRGSYQGTFNENFLKSIYDHVTPCIDCGGECPKGETATIFGKTFENTCFQFPIQFENPDGSTIKHIKDLIEYWKTIVSDSDSWHTR